MVGLNMACSALPVDAQYKNGRREKKSRRLNDVHKERNPRMSAHGVSGTAEGRRIFVGGFGGVETHAEPGRWHGRETMPTIQRNLQLAQWVCAYGFGVSEPLWPKWVGIDTASDPVGQVNVSPALDLGS
jgi:hypothetical protein